MIFTELSTPKDSWRIYLTLPSVPIQDEATHEVESDDDDDDPEPEPDSDDDM